MITQLSDAQRRSHEENLVATRTANGAELLRAVVARATVSDSTGRFLGDGRIASFMTWCSRPGEWLERCHALLAVVQQHDSDTVQLSEDGYPAFELWRTADSVSFAYFDSDNSEWRGSWEQIRLPRALAIVGTRDTMLLPLMSAHE